MRKLLILAILIVGITELNAQTVRAAVHMRPTGKGWSVALDPATDDAEEGAQIWQSFARNSTTNGILYHGGKIMPGNVHVYFIWYGNWTNGPKNSDSQLTVSLLDALYASVGGMGSSGYARINSTYTDTSHVVTGAFSLVQSATDNYSQGKNLTDAGVKAVVTRAIQSGRLPKDSNAIYFVLTSSDVNETSGLCNKYCGWHDHGTILSSDIKFSFVGNPDRCPLSCEAQTQSPNGDSGADGMASIMAHETQEAISDPDLNAWYDASGLENGDKCAWMYGPVHGTIGYGAYNQTFGTHNWLIQMTWENSRGGGCTQTKGGRFYNQ
jgi:Phosphate-induced protein 1 conserved region